MAATFATIQQMLTAGGTGRADYPRPRVVPHVADLHAGQGWLTSHHHTAIAIPPEMAPLVDLVDGMRDAAGGWMRSQRPG